jgi:hypothetical protein
MASETFGTGFCFDRQVSTAAIISSVNPMTFLKVVSKGGCGAIAASDRSEHCRGHRQGTCELYRPRFVDVEIVAHDPDRWFF